MTTYDISSIKRIFPSFVRKSISEIDFHLFPFTFIMEICTFITIWISYSDSILKLPQGIVREEFVFSSELNRLECFQILSKIDKADY